MRSNADETDANSQYEQQEPHSGLLGWPSAINGIAANFAKLPELLRQAGCGSFFVQLTGAMYWSDEKKKYLDDRSTQRLKKS